MRRIAKAFTLVELLVVIGIIAMLMSMLLPAVSRARMQAQSVKCKAQMRDMGIALNMYSQTYAGWIFPVGDFDTVNQRWKTLGYESMAKDPTGQWIKKVWPLHVFDPPRWDPAIMRCPSDYKAESYASVPDPVVAAAGNATVLDEIVSASHSYVLNKHLAEKWGKVVKFGTKVEFLNPNQVVVMGEKQSNTGDYYMELSQNGLGESEFDRIIEPARHGVRLGSNFLFLDWHVDLHPPRLIKGTVDPWQPPQVPPP